jgi:hypothetical protein
MIKLNEKLKYPKKSQARSNGWPDMLGFNKGSTSM